MGKLWPCTSSVTILKYALFWLVLNSLKCVKKTFPTPLHHLHHLDCWHKAGWSVDSYCQCQIRTIASVETWFITPGCVLVFTCPVLMSLCTWKPQIPVLRWKEQNPAWSSSVVAHSLQGLTYWAFWDVFLLTTVVKIWVTIAVLSVQTSPLRSDIIKMFLPLRNIVCVTLPKI